MLSGKVRTFSLSRGDLATDYETESGLSLPKHIVDKHESSACDKRAENTTGLLWRFSCEQRDVIHQLVGTLVAMSKRIESCEDSIQRFKKQMAEVREDSKPAPEEVISRIADDAYIRATFGPTSGQRRSVRTDVDPTLGHRLLSEASAESIMSRSDCDGNSDDESQKVSELNKSEDDPERYEHNADKVEHAKHNEHVVPPENSGATDPEPDRLSDSTADENPETKTIVITPTKTQRSDATVSHRSQRQADKENRKLTLVFYGIPEEEDEGCCDCFFKVRDFLWEELQVGDKGGKCVAIQYAYRLGFQHELREPRPILVKLLDLKLKQDILSKAREVLQGGSVRITEEYSSTTQEVCKRLVRQLIQRKLAEGKNVGLHRDLRYLR